MKVPRVLIIAGSDSGGGAGIQADIKTVTMLGGHAMTAITAITAQNTLGVDAVMPVPTEMVLAQIDAVVRDIGVDVVKIGMIGSAETAEAVADWLERYREAQKQAGEWPGLPIIFDPVMVATSGAVLAEDATIAAFRRLMDLAFVITPNAPELAALTGMPVGTEDELSAAGADLARQNGTYVLAKGGHLGGDEVIDRLFDMDGRQRHTVGPRIDTRHSHGTGCTLASAIAVLVGRDRDIGLAVDEAQAFVRAAMLAAPGFGAGHGPMGHWLGVNPFEVINSGLSPRT
jgi:hydroxymethylpyrimidine/phosphomethylpyrimidine kinase